MSRTKITALEGRVVESATVYHNDSENPLALELRFVGGLYFSFEATAKIETDGLATLGRNRKGNFVSSRKRTFRARGTVPYSMSAD